MGTEKVTLDLNKRFSAPLPDYYKRRIIFWYDEEREFEDKLDDIVLNNARLVRMTGNNTFTIKKLLSHDDLYSNYLVYCPISHEKPDDNWLMDIQLYSEEFRSDLISIWMDEIPSPIVPQINGKFKHSSIRILEKSIEEILFALIPNRSFFICHMIQKIIYIAAYHSVAPKRVCIQLQLKAYMAVAPFVYNYIRPARYPQ